MVRLRVGRFAWELYYTRTRAVLPREEVRRRVALIAGHLGYITGLLEYVMTDMLSLRAFALSGCVLIVGYQAAQPKINMVSAGWNSIFSVVNIYHIYLLLRKLPALSQEEKELLATHGEHITAQQFHHVHEAGTWRSFEAGDLLNDDEVCLVASGECEVMVGGLIVGRIGPGGVAGEVAIAAGGAGGDASATAAAKREADEMDAAVIATSAMRCLCLPLERLQKDPELREALRGVFALSLASKVQAANREATAQEYRAVLEVVSAAAGAPQPAVSAALEAFRQKHGITEQEHFRIADSVNERRRFDRRSSSAVGTQAVEEEDSE